MDNLEPVVKLARMYALGMWEGGELTASPPSCPIAIILCVVFILNYLSIVFFLYCAVLYVCHIRKSANYYDLLGVKSDASLEEIKNAFFDKSKKLHPDSDPSNPTLHSQFVELNEAYTVLSREPSRKEYDFKIRRPYNGGGEGGQVFRSASSHTNYGTSGATAQDNIRYWEQIYQSHTQEMSVEERERRRKRNFRLVAYCFLTMALSVGAHFIFFRKLEEVHSNFMDEKDRVITEIYKESKERARVNGFKKQTEILRQKHTEFLEKYKIRNGGEK